MRAWWWMLAAVTVAAAEPAAWQPRPVLGPLDGPTRHGISLAYPAGQAEAVEAVRGVRARGYDLLVLTGWPRPVPGSAEAARVEATLSACDEESVACLLRFHLPFAEAEPAVLNDDALEPSLALLPLADWTRLLAAHESTLGVLLDAGPTLPALAPPEAAPRLHQGLAAWRDDRRGPANDAPLDEAAFAAAIVAEYADRLISAGLTPVLGPRLYGLSGWPDPFLQPLAAQASLTVWEPDGPAALWRVQAVAQTSRRPLLTLSPRLYDPAQPRESWPDLARHRYLAGALAGELLTVGAEAPLPSDVQRVVQRTLQRTRAADAAFRQLARRASAADLRVLVTRSAWAARDAESPLALAHAAIAAAGRPWRYALARDLSGVRRGRVVVAASSLAPPEADALARLPRSVELLSLGPLPADVPEALRERVVEVTPATLATHLPTADAAGPSRLERRPLAAEYQRLGRGPDGAPVCVLEVRRAWERSLGLPDLEPGHLPRNRMETGEEALIAVVNHTAEAQDAPALWDPVTMRAEDLLNGGTFPQDPALRLHFAPLEVRVFRVRRTRNTGPGVGGWGAADQRTP